MASNQKIVDEYLRFNNLDAEAHDKVLRQDIEQRKRDAEGIERISKFLDSLDLDALKSKFRKK